MGGRRAFETIRRNKSVHDEPWVHFVVLCGNSHSLQWNVPYTTLSRPCFYHGLIYPLLRRVRCRIRVAAKNWFSAKYGNTPMGNGGVWFPRGVPLHCGVRGAAADIGLGNLTVEVQILIKNHRIANYLKLSRVPTSCGFGVETWK